MNRDARGAGRLIIVLKCWQDSQWYETWTWRPLGEVTIRGSTWNPRTEPLAFLNSLCRMCRRYRVMNYRIISAAFRAVQQGQCLIAGWTDDEAGLISTHLPVVVFGDHTRAFKYVDFPFVRGADGTQVLKPKAGIDPLFFYYACRAIELPSRGYNRHFKALKEQEIPTPPLQEQRSIAQALRRIDDTLSIQDEQLHTAQALKRAAMHTLFTRGLRGEAQKETEIGPLPKSWEPKAIHDLCEIWSGGTPRTSIADYWDGDIPWVSGKDLKTPRLDDAKDHVSVKGVESGSRLAPENAVLLLVRGMGLAKDLPVASISRPMAFNQDVKALVSRGQYSGTILRSAIYASKERLLGRIVSSAHGTMTLNLDDVERFKIPVPSDPTEVEEIAHILDAIDRKIDLHCRKRVVLEELFKALLYKLMTGEIRVGELELAEIGGDR